MRSYNGSQSFEGSTLCTSDDFLFFLLLFCVHLIICIPALCLKLSSNLSLGTKICTKDHMCSFVNTSSLASLTASRVWPFSVFLNFHNFFLFFHKLSSFWGGPDYATGKFITLHWTWQTESYIHLRGKKKKGFPEVHQVAFIALKVHLYLTITVLHCWYDFFFAASHCSFIAFQMNLAFMRHSNAVSSQILCSRIQCGNARQLRGSVNGPSVKMAAAHSIYTRYR